MIVKQPLKIGTKLNLKKSEEEDEKEDVFKVIATYPHFVLCRNAKGIRQCVTNATLYGMGLVDPVREFPQPREKARQAYERKG